VEALSIDDETGAVLVDDEKCISCGECIEKCPGEIPFLHPSNKKAVICDLCGGNPECVKVCQEARFGVLRTVREQKSGPGSYSRRLFARTPESLTKDLETNLFGDIAEELR
jgi:Fe-S-cluster-containing dehydrogenase component